MKFSEKEIARLTKESNGKSSQEFIVSGMVIENPEKGGRCELDFEIMKVEDIFRD